MARTKAYIAAMAGAGTGKTYSLVENYLSALVGLHASGTKKRPHEILALTFTEKAASEMRIRIAKQLSFLYARPNEPHPLREFAQELDLPFPDQDELKRILRALPNAPIATFHSFCSMLIRREARAFGIDDRFTILAPRDERMAARSILKPIVLTEIQRHNSVMRSLVARFRLSNGLMSFGLLDSILDLYGKLWEKGLSSDEMEIATIKSGVRSEELRALAEDVDGALRNIVAMPNSDRARDKLNEFSACWSDFMTAQNFDDEVSTSQRYEVLRNSIKGNFGNREARAALVSSVIRLGARLVDHFVSDDARELARVVHEFHQAFDQWKSKAFLLSYSDLLSKTKMALTRDLALRKRVKASINHILVDEYQDTSPLQEDIIAMLAEGKNHEQSISLGDRVITTLNFLGGPSLFVVGDKKQSIYGFRGANVKLFDDMMDTMRASAECPSDFEKRLLTVNRRSGNRIIELINLVSSATLIGQGYDDDQALHALSADDEARCSLWVYEDDGQEDKTLANLSCTAHGVKKLHNERPNLNLKDVVVLVRRIKSASLLKEKLSRLGIPARIVQGEGFFQQQEIVDLLSALKLVIDPSDALATAVVLRSPLVLLADQEILWLKSSSLEHGISFLNENLQHDDSKISDDGKERLRKFLGALVKIRERLMGNGLASAIDMLIDECDFSYFIGLSHNPHQKWANIEKLRIMLAKQTGNPFAAIVDLYDRIFENDKEPQADAEASADAVTIMTIHQSKGLEFTITILADGESLLPANQGDILADKNFGILVRPRGRAIDACSPKDAGEREIADTRYGMVKDAIRRSEQEEQARLLYVALTRAKQELIVASSRASFMAQDTKSLLGQFLRAYHQWPERFLQCCDVVDIQAQTGEQPALKKEVEISFGARYEPAPGVTRLFASSLMVRSEDSPIHALVQRSSVTKEPLIDGDLAHKMLASLGSVFPRLHRVPEAQIEQLLKACLRSLGIDKACTKTLSLVQNTVNVLCEELKTMNRTVSEMPIFCDPMPHVVIEGFADLVVEHDDFVGVIEFKSSLKKVHAPDTYFQVLAYAHALSSQFLKPVRFAVMMVGEAHRLQFAHYDQKTRDHFLAEIACLLSPSPGFSIPRDDTGMGAVGAQERDLAAGNSATLPLVDDDSMQGFI